MDDVISRQKAINVIERMRAYIGHNMERAVGAAFIEILDDVGEDIGRLPSAQFATDTNVGTKLGTNLAQLGTDCISRQTVLDAIDEISCEVADGYGFDYAKWREYFCELPSVLGTNLAEVGTNCSEVPNSSDCISRQAAIDALGEKPLAWTEGEYELGLQNQWQSDVDAVKELPSVTPKQRTGKWISADAMFHGVPFYCSECGENTLDTVMGKPRWNFCPNCGADMRGEQK